MPNPAVPKSTGPRPPSVVEEIIEDVEDVFSPKPGGMIDRHHQEKARRDAAEAERRNIAERVEESTFKAVKVTQLSPEVFGANVVTIQPGGNAQILPMSPYRSRATITVITAASTVLLSPNPSQALGGTGFPLVSGQLLPVNSRGQLYAVNNGGAAVQVAVLTELYAPEK